MMDYIKTFDEVPARILKGPKADYFQTGRANIVKCTREQMKQVVAANTGFTGETENFIIIDNTTTDDHLDLFIFIIID